MKLQYREIVSNLENVNGGEIKTLSVQSMKNSLHLV